MRIILLSLLLLIAPLLSFAETPNVGFVQGIWYADNAVFAEKPTRVYVAFRNNSPHDLSGTIRFADNGKRIGSADVHALSGRLVEAWVDWTPTFGTHSITAEFTGGELHIIGEGTKPVDGAALVAENVVFIDTDTDGDGAGDAEDTDDDNDQVSDVKEKERGTDPLVGNPITTEVPAEETESPLSSYITPVPQTTADAKGLEQYLDTGPTHTAIGSLSEKIEDAKQSIDTYRETRNKALYTAPETDTQSVHAPSEAGDTATITRTQIDEKQGLFGTIIDGFKTLFAHIWTFILWIASRVLGHPALLQFGILILILYFFYRTARKLGRRRLN